MATFVRANGLRFAMVRQGPADGPLALLLHGFPDTAHTWRHLVPVLAEAGYRVAAPWMRGYAPTEAAPGGSTTLETLAADANSLHRALGGDERAIVIGHDWGAMAAARAAAAAPARWSRVVLMAVPPEPALAGAARDLGQLRRSRYVAALALPGAERRLARDDLAAVARLWQAWSPGYDASEDLAHVRMSLRDADSRATVLAPYRWLASATLRGRYPSATAPVPSQPTLVLHGERDGCVGVGYARGAAAYLPHPDSEAVCLPAGHFLHLEEPARVERAVLGFLSRNGGASNGPTVA